MEFIELSDGVRLRTWTTGTPTSVPPVILLHGGPGLWDYLEPVADLMSDLTVVHRFDQRGCGGSDSSPEQTMQRFAQEREYRALSWFTDHADRASAWAWALEDAAVPNPINFTANRVLNAETDSWTDDDLARTAASLQMPVWFVHGSGDPRPASAVESLAGRVPNAELHVIEAAGHEQWRERPSEFRAIWVNLLERVG